MDELRKPLVVALCLGLVVCPVSGVWAAWTFTTNSPSSFGSTTSLGLTTGGGQGPAVGDTAQYRFEQLNGNFWSLKGSAMVQVVDVGMGTPVWSQTLDGHDWNLGTGWPPSAPNPGMPGARLPDYRARLWKDGVVDAAIGSITVNP